MRRWIIAVLLAVSPVMALALCGCGEKETRVERRSERIEKSEPRTVSPGDPVVE